MKAKVKLQKHIWRQEAKCKYCGGTGIYKGFAEQGTVGVVCNKCNGTGKVEIKIEWEDFKGRVKREDITRVAQCNPGICIDEDPRFGGMPYDDWLDGKPFPPKSENREFTCPAWWYQTANLESKPDWDECYQNLGSRFSACPLFKRKHLCWQRWDLERGR